MLAHCSGDDITNLVSEAGRCTTRRLWRGRYVDEREQPIGSGQHLHCRIKVNRPCMPHCPPSWICPPCFRRRDLTSMPVAEVQALERGIIKYMEEVGVGAGDFEYALQRSNPSCRWVGGWVGWCFRCRYRCWRRQNAGMEEACLRPCPPHHVQHWKCLLHVCSWLMCSPAHAAALRQCRRRGAACHLCRQAWLHLKDASTCRHRDCLVAELGGQRMAASQLPAKCERAAGRQCCNSSAAAGCNVEPLTWAQSGGMQQIGPTG